MNTKNLQLIMLGILLIAVIATGVVILNIEMEPSVQPPSSMSVGETEETVNLVGQKIIAYQQTQNAEDFYSPDQGFQNVFLYEGQICRFTYVEGDSADEFAVALQCVTNGNVIHTYDASWFPASFDSLFLDDNGQLWSMFWDSEGYELLGICNPDTTVDELFPINNIPIEWNSLYGFAVCNNDILIHYQNNGQRYLSIYNKDTEQVTTLEGVISFVLDGKGYVYYLTSQSKIAKHELSTGTEVWDNTDLLNNGYWPRSIFYGGDKLYLLDSYSGIKVYSVDTQSGAIGVKMVDFWESTDISDDIEPYLYGISFAIDDFGKIVLSTADFDFSDPASSFCNRLTWILEPYEVLISPEQQVTLTITAPYPVDSLLSAIRQYQSSHPNVKVVWDTQYISREEFQKNSLQYKEQIALRVMTGDVGDLVMICGSGLSQDVITDTDAFTDLMPYLESCSFLDELEMSMLEPLRSDDDTVRGIPVATQASYFIYNESLLKQLGSPVNPDTVSWSELLDLALQWKHDEIDLSLISAETSAVESTKQTLLAHLLLANLYGTEQDDGSAELDNEHIRNLLKKLKELWTCPQLVRSDGSSFTTGFFKKSLFTTASQTRRFEDRILDLADMEERENVRVRIAPKPWGEKYKKQQAYGFCWGISSFSEQKDAAWNLLEFFISSEGLPSYTYTQESDAFNNTAMHNRYGAFVESGYTSKDTSVYFGQLMMLKELPISRYDEPYGWRDAVYSPILNYLEGKTTLDEALNLASDNWERFLLG